MVASLHSSSMLCILARLWLWSMQEILKRSKARMIARDESVKSEKSLTRFVKRQHHSKKSPSPKNHCHTISLSHSKNHSSNVRSI
jgi:hypothetical protein